jgi:hypothetical protein
MADTPTLHSRLRVLVARTFRAEKLYSSMRNNGSANPADPSKLAEIANDVRSSVWQRRHYQLRKAINHVLSEVGSSDVAGEITLLRDRFQRKADEHRQLVDDSRAALVETAERSEFARSLKLSLELIRSKAEMQANQIIADELTAVVQVSRRGKVPAESALFSADLDAPPAPVMEESKVAAQAGGDCSNVIPFRRKVSGMRGSRG